MNPKAREERLLCEQAQDELVVYDQKQKKAHLLNQAAALVWTRCDGQRSVADLAALLREELNPEADEDLVWVALDQLKAAHLLEETNERTADQARSTRRQVARKLARAGVALLVPAITTLNVPTSADMSSVMPCH